MRNFINELKNRTFTKGSKITVKDFMHQWFEVYVKGQLSPTNDIKATDNDYIIYWADI